MIATVISCDSCGGQRKETNHWWTLVPTPDGRITVGPMVEDNGVPDHHYCGRECLQAAIERWCENRTESSLEGKKQ